MDHLSTDPSPPVVDPSAASSAPSGKIIFKNAAMDAMEAAEHIGVLRKAGTISQEAADDMIKTIMINATKCSAVPVMATALGDEPSLTKHFKEAEMRQIHPWLFDVARTMKKKESWMKMTLDELKAIFLVDAKAGDLSTTEVMLSIYLLWGGPEDLDFCRALLVMGKGQDRVLMHNMFVASHREESFMESHGQQVVDLTLPLFPPSVEFNYLNNQVLKASKEVSGGGPRVTKSVFRDGEHGGDPLGGAVTFPVEVNPDGSAYVDVTCVSDVVNNITRTNAMMQSQIQALTASVQGKSKSNFWKKKNYQQQNPQQQNYQQQNQQQHHQQNYQQQHHQQNYQQQNYNNNPAPAYNARGGNPSGEEAPVTPSTTMARRS